jgi:uncharacterized protein
VVVANVLEALIAHGANPEVTWVGLANIFLAGVLLAMAYLRTRSLWFASALHLGWNWSMAALFALPVSGLDLFLPPGYRAQVGGPDWWSGGAFGPEGGLVATIALASALAVVLRAPALDPDARAPRPLWAGPEERAA